MPRDRTQPPPKPTTPRGIEPRPRRGSDGRWVWKYRVRWTDPTSGRRPVEEFDTIDQALDFLAHLRLARRRGVLEDLTRGDAILRDFVEHEWWPNDAGRRLEINTLATYTPVWNRHLNPRVGHLRLRALTPPVVQQLKEDLQADGVGAPTVRRALAILQGICRYAVAKGELNSNPVKEIKKPSATRTRAVIAISPEQVERLRRVLTAGFTITTPAGQTYRHPPDPTSAALVSLLAYEGLRPEEALALDDDHVRKATILVEQRNIRGTLVIGQKGMGRRGSRSATLFSPVRADIAEYRLATRRPAGSALIFYRADGTPWRDHDYRNWRARTFKPAVIAAELPISRPYDLRHACASLMLAANTPLREIAEHMGHSIAVLSDTYAHLIADLKGQPVLPVDEAISQARGKLNREAM